MQAHKRAHRHVSLQETTCNLCPSFPSLLFLSSLPHLSSSYYRFSPFLSFSPLVLIPVFGRSARVTAEGGREKERERAKATYASTGRQDMVRAEQNCSPSSSRSALSLSLSIPSPLCLSPRDSAIERHQTHTRSERQGMEEAGWKRGHLPSPSSSSSGFACRFCLRFSLFSPQSFLRRRRHQRAFPY